MADAGNAPEWRSVQGYPDYEVSNDGRVRRVTMPSRGPGRSRSLPYEIAISYDERGRPAVGLACPGNRSGQKRFQVSWLVAEAFHGARPAPGYVVCHNNGDHTDNRASNLRWDTQAGNIADKRIHGTQLEGNQHPNAKLTDDEVRQIRAARAAGETLKSIAARYGVHFSLIQYIEQRKVWKHVP
ncbi:MAG TPA: HNH endonuclease [Geminicoccus sp.]|uniref:HNH endonuclease n=1 Tax=Geminicoccus sp. TaxID=2024832 RepID=UPI002B9645EF|nr:HNH endonuclease [Geminicoccus sp.]HWL69164.1 HNH endonuclease [Geminicoccus sp.]